jgi:hypothetical protein
VHAGVKGIDDLRLPQYFAMLSEVQQSFLRFSEAIKEGISLEVAHRVQVRQVTSLLTTRFRDQTYMCAGMCK